VAFSHPCMLMQPSRAHVRSYMIFRDMRERVTWPPVTKVLSDHVSSCRQRDNTGGWAALLCMHDIGIVVLSK
jgi:hypothetical protein